MERMGFLQQVTVSRQQMQRKRKLGTEALVDVAVDAAEVGAEVRVPKTNGNPLPLDSIVGSISSMQAAQAVGKGMVGIVSAGRHLYTQILKQRLSLLLTPTASVDFLDVRLDCGSCSHCLLKRTSCAKSGCSRGPYFRRERHIWISIARGF